MGIKITQRDAKFKILASNKEKALAVLQQLMVKKNRHGGPYYYNPDVKTLRDAIWWWRWDTLENSNEDVIAIKFFGETFNEEDMLMNTLAPYVVSESFIEMESEDHKRWRWVFDGKNVHKIKAKVCWGPDLTRQSGMASLLECTNFSDPDQGKLIIRNILGEENKYSIDFEHGSGTHTLILSQNGLETIHEVLGKFLEQIKTS